MSEGKADISTVYGTKPWASVRIFLARKAPRWHVHANTPLSDSRLPLRHSAAPAPEGVTPPPARTAGILSAAHGMKAFDNHVTTGTNKKAGYLRAASRSRANPAGTTSLKDIPLIKLASREFRLSPPFIRPPVGHPAGHLPAIFVHVRAPDSFASRTNRAARSHGDVAGPGGAASIRPPARSSGLHAHGGGAATGGIAINQENTLMIRNSPGPAARPVNAPRKRLRNKFAAIRHARRAAAAAAAPPPANNPVRHPAAAAISHSPTPGHIVAAPSNPRRAGAATRPITIAPVTPACKVVSTVMRNVHITGSPVAMDRRHQQLGE